MSFLESLRHAEESLAQALESKRAGIDDRTGKGSAAERIVDEQLLKPHLPPGLRSAKGAVVTSEMPDAQSPAIDRIIYDQAAASPLIFDDSHSIFPIEAVNALVEITINLDADKLAQDIARMAPIKSMRKRRFLAPSPNSNTRAVSFEQEFLSPRSYVIGLPADSGWRPETIAGALRRIQMAAGPPTHVHGLYVIGSGFYQTIPVDSPTENMYRIRGWTGPDRLFRFTTAFRQTFDSWGTLPRGWSTDLRGYVQGECKILAE